MLPSNKDKYFLRLTAFSCVALVLNVSYNWIHPQEGIVQRNLLSLSRNDLRLGLQSNCIALWEGETSFPH